jgi:L-alanine-DL-glutamate epimerase-like enolase superfamily enzyme
VASYVLDGFLIVRVHTDEGLTGLGEPSPYAGPLPEVEAALAGPVRSALVGRDPYAVAELTRQRPAGAHGAGTAAYAAGIAAMSQALWDIIGKAEGKPVYRLLNPDLPASVGVRAYASGGMTFEWNSDDMLVEEAARCQAGGFAAWKVRPPLPERASHQARSLRPPRVDVDRFIRVLRRLREEVGDAMQLMVDAGCRLAPDDAVAIGREMARLGFYFFEEPLPRSTAAYADLRSKVSVPIAGGETLLAREAFGTWLDASAYDVVQPDANLAGITETLAVAELARGKGARVVLHNWANDVSAAANIHVAAAIGDSPMVEHNVTFNPLRGQLVDNPLVPLDGSFRLTDRPGLGIELRDDVLARYRVR